MKGLIQKTLSVVPGGVRMNDMLQRSVGSFRRLDAEVTGKIEDFRLMARQLRATSVAIEGARFLEIGAGWYPTLAVCLYLVGAERVHALDRVRHLQPDLLRKLIARLESEVPSIAEAAGVYAGVCEARRAHLRASLSTGAMLRDASEGCIDYRAPADAAATELPQHSVDVVFSSSMLEHIPLVVLDNIFAESWRILRPGGVMFHSVNCGDHYAYTDPSVGQLHYLKYSERQWRLLWNNELQYQNRLRAIDFINLARKHDFEIVRDTTKIDPDRLAELRALPRVAREFRGYSPEELCVTTVDLIARK
jgi:SAM-dependent methyltransferase